MLPSKTKEATVENKRNRCIQKSNCNENRPSGKVLAFLLFLNILEDTCWGFLKVGLFVINLFIFQLIYITWNFLKNSQIYPNFIQRNFGIMHENCFRFGKLIYYKER